MIRSLLAVILVAVLGFGAGGCSTTTMYRVSGKQARSDAECTKHVKPGEYCEKRSEVSSRAVLTGLVVGTLLVVAVSAGGGYGDQYNGLTQGD